MIASQDDDVAILLNKNRSLREMVILHPNISSIGKPSLENCSFSKDGLSAHGIASICGTKRKAWHRAIGLTIASNSCAVHAIRARLSHNLLAAPTGQLVRRRPVAPSRRSLALDSPLCDLLAWCIVATLWLLFWSAACAYGTSRRRSGLSHAFTLLLLLQGAAWLLPAAEAAGLDNAARVDTSSQIAGAYVRGHTKGVLSPSPPAQAPPPSGLLPVKGMVVVEDAGQDELQTPSSNKGDVASLAHNTALDWALVPHGRGLQVTVSDVADLLSKVADPSVSRIVVASGHYALTAQLNVKRAVTIEAVVPGSVVLDAQASSSATRRVLSIDPASASNVVELIGLNVTGGVVGWGSDGGGLEILNGQVTLNQVHVYKNTKVGTFGGGGLAILGGAVTMSGCTVFSNDAFDYGNGGGLLITSSAQVTLISCNIYDNAAGFNEGGGGIHIYGTAAVQMIDCRIFSNHAGDYGGGILVGANSMYTFDGTLTMIRCSIFSNTAIRYDGGGFYVESGKVTMDDCHVFSNAAHSCTQPIDGHICAKLPMLMNSNCVCTRGSWTASGGGVHVIGGKVIMSKTVVINNVALIGVSQLILHQFRFGIHVILLPCSTHSDPELHFLPHFSGKYFSYWRSVVL